MFDEIVESPYYDEAPQTFNFSQSGDNLTINYPPRNSNIQAPNLPPSFTGDTRFIINGSDGYLTGEWATIPRTGSYDGSYDSCTKTMFAIGNVIIRAALDNVGYLYIGAYDRQSHATIWTSSGPVMYNQYHRAFLIFMHYNDGTKDYYLPYPMGSNIIGLGCTQDVDEYYDLAAYNGIAPVTEDPYETAPESGSDGGYGDYDYSGDAIDFPTLPSISVVDSGLVSLFKPDINQLQSLASYMWSGLFDINAFRKIFADPMDCIISLSIIPVNPTSGAAKELKVGNIGTGINIDTLANQFVEVTYKSLNFGQRTKTFMDDSPYTKAQIYLPFIGTRSLSIDDVIRSDIYLKYFIDLFTGACTACIKCVKHNKDENSSLLSSVLYQFTGNVIANIPITGVNFASFIQATMGAVSAAVGVATGAGAITGVASAINAATSMKPDVEKSGNMGGTAGFLGGQTPYLILTYPHLCRPSGRDKTVGTPSFIGLSDSKKLGSFSGYTQLHKINVKGIYCTETERNMIEQALTGEGVII